MAFHKYITAIHTKLDTTYYQQVAAKREQILGRTVD